MLSNQEITGRYGTATRWKITVLFKVPRTQQINYEITLSEGKPTAPGSTVAHSIQKPLFMSEN